MSPPSSGRSSFDQPIGAMPRLTAGLVVEVGWVKVTLRFAAAERRESVDVGECHRDAEDRALEAGLADTGLGLSPALGATDSLEDDPRLRHHEPDLLDRGQALVVRKLTGLVVAVRRRREHLD